MKNLIIDLAPCSELNAIYFGLSLSKYEYATINKHDDIDEMQRRIGECRELDNAMKFFRMARGDTCEVYPFWPRVALLESALFFIKDGTFDISKYRNYVEGLSNITDEERDEDFFEWVKNFPVHLGQIMDNGLFKEIDSQLHDIVYSLHIADELDKLCDALASLPMETGIHKITVLVCPIKCCHSADYFTHECGMFVMLGDFLPHSVVHEYLHLVVNPLVQEHKAHILTTLDDKGLNIDPSYYLNNDDSGLLNAFEEHIVRVAAEKISSGQEMDILHMILSERL